jgi:HSP20 family protein
MNPKKHYLDTNAKVPGDKWGGLFKEVFFSSSKLVMMYTERSWHPPTDVYETAEELIIKTEVAGINPEEDITLTIENDQLIIQGKRTDCDKRQKRVFRQMEINYGNLSRVIHLSKHIVIDKATATYKEGFLEIVIPKIGQTQTANGSKQIKVKK